MNAAIFHTPLNTLEDQITELAAHISAATWRLLVLIREYDLRAGWNCGATKSCAHWLNWKCGIGLGAAREKVRVAHALAELPQTSAAFREPTTIARASAIRRCGPSPAWLRLRTRTTTS